MHPVHHAVHIDGNHLIPFCGILRRDVRQPRNAGIVEQAVHRPVKVLCFLHGRRQGCAVAHVDGSAEGVGQGQGLHAFDATGHQQQRVSASCECLGGGFTDAGTGTGDGYQGLVSHGLPHLGLLAL